MKKLEGYLRKLRSWLLMSWYVVFYGQERLKESWILIDSKNGKDLGSNLLRIAEELAQNPDYRDYKIFLSYGKGKKAAIRRLMDRYGLKAVLIWEGGFRYARISALAKYLFTDTSFPLWYTKKKGQLITNTWHGTPLKKMGKDVKNRAYDMGNVQKSQLIADYLIYPSDYMKEVMTSAYFLANLYQGNILCSGYPRNSVFFDSKKAEKIRADLGLEKKKLYGYMPTWRGILKQIDSGKNAGQIERFLIELDQELSRDEVFFVRLHPFIKDSIDYSQYRHIRPFPDDYDPYDILNLCDCMVTDYSSVMFDYANSRRKLILFVFDKESYIDERGLYVSMDTFPFPQVRSVQELLWELRAPKTYDDRDFLEKFCQYDGEDTARKLCRHIIKGEKVFEEFHTDGNGKENVLIYSGDLSRNGLTTSLLNLFSNIDMEKRNYYVTFSSVSLQKEPDRVSLLPQQAGLFPIASVKGESLGEGIAAFLYFYGHIATPFLVKKVERFFKRLYESNFGFCRFDVVIQYAGYDRKIIQMFQQAPTERMIFAHNDMVRELALKYHPKEPAFRTAYQNYDKVIPVTEDIYPSILQLRGRAENICVINNCHDYRSVLERAGQELEFQKNTDCNISIENLQEILNSKSRKFINIGRFSPEKGHDMLIEAFYNYYKENPDSYLIIIGGYGSLYQQTVSLAESVSCGEHIVIIQCIANPMPILKKCDLFVLSSLYEGLGLVLLEADTLGIPVISTDVPGPRGFLKQHGGYLVPPDAEGICEGLRAFDEGRIKAMDVDYEEYNRGSVRQFENLF